ncbi:hypothetical protein ACFQ88_23625 [Paenibacillus sp. NPDC056579]|uniref:hypothetical protein n=1 Tax=Paenibacillus sp. NPDC056579 TaxID=3345871 RepID=UPI0036939222
MLKDIERKVLRILANLSLLHNRTPTLREIGIKVGQDDKGVMNVWASLAKE